MEHDDPVAQHQHDIFLFINLFTYSIYLFIIFSRSKE